MGRKFKNWLFPVLTLLFVVTMGVVLLLTGKPRNEEQIRLENPNRPDTAAAAVSTGTAFPLDLNSADQAALEQLPAIGPARAAAIVADRETNGPFQSIDELTRVSGIGPATLDLVRDLLYVEEQNEDTDH